LTEALCTSFFVDVTQGDDILAGDSPQIRSSLSSDADQRNIQFLIWRVNRSRDCFTCQADPSARGHHLHRITAVDCAFHEIGFLGKSVAMCLHNEIWWKHEFFVVNSQTPKDWPSVISEPGSVKP